jgi:Tfp pilus assembly protein PilF
MMNVNGEIPFEFSKIVIKGSDASSYLKSQLPCELPTLGTGRSASFLDVTGKIEVTFFLIYDSELEFSVLIARKDEEKFVTRLDKFHISEDFEIEVFQEKGFVQIGPVAFIDTSLEGIPGHPFEYLGLPCLLTDKSSGQKELINSELEVLEHFTGVTNSYDARFLTDSKLVEIHYDQNKGCFPGQETIAKIVNNRGASFFPFTVLSNQKISEQISVDGKKILIPLVSLQSGNGYSNFCLVSREFRVNGKKVEHEDLGVLFFQEIADLKSKQIDFLGQIYLEALEYFNKDEQVDRALTILENICRFHFRSEDALESYGVMLGKKKKYIDAIEVMKELIEINPKSIMAHTNLSLFYMNIGDIDQAEFHKGEAIFKEFESLGEDNSEDSQEDIQKEAMFREVLEIDQEDEIANFGLGEIFFKREVFAKARDHFEIVIKSNPKHSQSYLKLAKSLKALKSPPADGIIEILEKGIEVAAKNGDMIPANEMQVLLNSIS